MRDHHTCVPCQMECYQKPVFRLASEIQVIPACLATLHSCRLQAESRCQVDLIQMSGKNRAPLITFQNSRKQGESGKTCFAANPMGPSGAPSAPRGHKSSPRAHVGNPWENKGKLRFRVVPLCRVRGGISGEGFPDSNELAAHFFTTHSFSHSNVYLAIRANALRP